MRKLFGVILILGIILSCSRKTGFVVTGSLIDAGEHSVYLKKVVDKQYVIVDSAIVRKGNFRLSGSVKFPEMHLLEIPAINSQLRFFVENSVISINGAALDNALISGSKTEEEYQAYKKLIAPFEARISEIYEEYSRAEIARDEKRMKELESDYEIQTRNMQEIQILYIRNNPASFITPTILSSISYSMQADEIDELIRLLDKKVAATPTIISLQKRVYALRSTEIGEPAPDFQAKDVEGKNILLSQKIGAKLLLLDFWASWCSPCRKENPNVVAVYRKYKGKGFDVLAVSLDKDKEKWLQAIEDDKLTWTHVSQLEGWICQAADKYAVLSIPANFLIDENGIIIAKNLRGENLEKKVKEILGE